MKRHLALGLVMAAVLAVAGSASGVARADDASKFVGDWALKVMTDDGQSLMSTLKLTQEDGKLKGTFVGQDGTEAKAEDITVKGSDLNFKVTLDFQGTELLAKFALKQDGANLKGTVDYDLGGQTGTLDVSGNKAGGAKLQDGTWNLEIQTDDGQTLKASATFKTEGDKLTGTFVGVDGTEAKVDEATIKDGELAFKVTIDFQGSELVAKFKLKAADAGAKGTVDYDLGGQTGTLDVIAKRPAGGGDAKLAGTWNVEVATDDGQTLKSDLKLETDGDKVSGVFVAPDGKEVKLEDVKLAGSELSFKINVDFEGTALAASFKGKVDGGSIKGQVDYDLSGQTGTLDFTAKKGEAKK